MLWSRLSGLESGAPISRASGLYGGVEYIWDSGSVGVSGGLG